MLRTVIEDISDPAVIAATRRAIEDALRGVADHGEWTVALAASDTRGRWDVGVRGPHGRHFFSFAAPLARVPEFTRQYLERKRTLFK